MFIISLSYKKPLGEVEKHLAEHLAFLDKNYQQKTFIASGRKHPRTGGIILANNVSASELNELLKEDPFMKHHIADYQITEFIPSKYDERFGCFVETGGQPK